MGNAQSISQSFLLDGREYITEFDKDCFVDGATRCDYWGQIKSVSFTHNTRGGKCVVKVYKRHDWNADNRASLKAKEMADLFNCKKIAKDYLIEFILPIFSTVKTSANVMVSKGATIAIERYIDGEHCTFMSNSSWTNIEQSTSVPEAFSHFTFHESKGHILVTDLKGVQNKNSFSFTDPAIHSIGDEFSKHGPTDLGFFGVARFFTTHKCSNICRAFIKPDMEKIPSDFIDDFAKVNAAITPMAYTTYSFQLSFSRLTHERIQQLHTEISAAILEDLNAKHDE